MDGINSQENAKLHSSEGVIRFKVHFDNETLETDDPRKVPCSESPQFLQHHMTWKLKVCVDGIFDKYVNVQLVSVFNENTEDWTCKAAAKIKALSNGHNNDYEQELDFIEFTKANSMHGFEEFILWKDFRVKDYVKNNVATFDVRILTKPPDRIPGIQHTSTTFRMRLLDLKNLDDLRSEEVIIRGIRWQIRTMKINDHLGVFLYANEDDMDLEYSWEVTATFTLASLGGAGESLTKTFKSVMFNWTNNAWGFSEFIKWSELIDENKKYTKNNAALLDIDVIVKKPIVIS